LLVFVHAVSTPISTLARESTSVRELIEQGYAVIARIIVAARATDAIMG